MKPNFISLLLVLLYAGISGSNAGKPKNVLRNNPIVNGDAEVIVVLHDGAEFASKKKFTPPVRITYRLKTDGDTRLNYGADQIILNWAKNEQELRINGGPADQQHVKGGGQIPKNEFVTITQTVLPHCMSIAVNGAERARWKADFSQVKRQIRIFPFRSTVTVKEVLVEPIEESGAEKSR